MQNETSKLNKKENDKKRLLILKKYNLSTDKNGKIFDQIKNFIKSKKILELNDKIKLGKLEILKGPRYDKNKNIIPYSYVGPDKYFIFHRREALKNVNPVSKNDYKNKKYNQKYSKIKSDKDMLSKFLKSFTKRLSIKNIENEKKIKKPLPKSVKNDLKRQENILKRYGTYENLQENLEKMIMKRTNKRKNDLLLKLTTESNNSIKNYLKTSDISENLKNWNFKLRNPKKDGKYERNGYFKATSLNEDLFSIINLNHENKIYVNPFMNLFDKTKKTSLNKRKNKEEYLRNIKLQGIKIMEKKIINKNQRKSNIVNETNQSFKYNSFKNLSYNFSLNEKNERNINNNFDEKIFAFDYNTKTKYILKKKI